MYYGEKINMYTNDDPIHQEFIEAGLEYIRSVGDIATAIPIYKIFPTKTYRDYVNIVHRIHAIGKLINSYKDILMEHGLNELYKSIKQWN